MKLQLVQVACFGECKPENEQLTENVLENSLD